MVIYEKPTVKIEYNLAKKQLIQVWDGFSSSEVFREAIDKTVTFVKTNPVKSIVSDTMKQSVVKPEDTEYASEKMPILFKSGIQAMAFVIPKNVLTQLSLKGFNEPNKDLKVGFFATILDAQYWIDQNIKIPV